MERKKCCITIAILLSLVLALCSCSMQNPTTSNNAEGNNDILFYRKVAREFNDDGWVYTFVNNGWKDPDADDSNLYKFQFFGINLRYKYNENYIQTITRELPNGEIYIERVIPTCLILGTGLDAEKRDMQLIEEILYNKNYSAEELLALDPDDYTFEVIDKEMFFRLMRTALTSEPQAEGEDKSYWEKPTYAFFTEPDWRDGYKFQIAFVQETGGVDELYIDVLFKTGEGYDDYIQLSDLIDAQSATADQTQAFEMIKSITMAIRERDNFMATAEDYKNIIIDGIDFSRLYTFLKNIHENKFDQYYESPIIEKVEGAA